MKNSMRLTSLLLAFNWLVLPASSQTAASTASFTRGCEQMMHKNFSGAISSFTEAISDDATDVNSYFRRGQSFFCVGNYKEAIVDFDRALAKGAMDYNVYLWKGTAYAKLGDMDRSVFNYEKAMRLNPKLVATFKSSASSKLTDAQAVANPKSPTDTPNTVLESRIEAVRAAAANINATKIGVGVLESDAKPKGSGSTLSLGSSQKPLEAYETAARKIVENDIGYFRTGTTYSGLVNRSGSIIPLSGFCGEPDWVETAQKGHAYLSLKDPSRDVRELDAQIVLHPQDAKFYFQRARVFQQLGKSKETLSDLNRAIELDGANAHFYLARAFYYHQQNNDNAAESEIRRAQEVDPIVPTDLSFEMPSEKERSDKT